MAQTSRGVTLFGNSYGMLVYDGAFWTLMPVSNHSTVRSILVSEQPGSQPCIYVGASNEFGRFIDLNGRGLMQYESLVSTIKGKSGEFGEIWGIYGNDNNVWFCGDYNVYCYDGNTTVTIQTGKKITCTQQIGENIYLAFADGSISLISASNPHTLLPILTADRSKLSNISAIMPYGQGTLLLATRFTGLYLLEGDALRPLSLTQDSYIKDNELFCATIHGDKLVLGTVSGGVVIVNLNTSQYNIIDTDNGLGNNTVLNATFDCDDNLWLGLDNGLDYVNLNAPISLLVDSRSSIGTGHAALISGEKAYLGTNQGLYTLSYPIDRTTYGKKLKPEINGQVWRIDTIGGDIFVCNDNGLYFKPQHGGSFRRVDGLPGAVSITAIDSSGKRAMVSTYDNFYAIERTTDGWRKLSHIGGYTGVSGQPIAAGNDNYWISDWLKGVYRLHLNPERMTFDRVDLFENKGGVMNISRLGDEIVITSGDGYYVVDELTDSLVAYNGKYKADIEAFPASRFMMSPIGRMWIVSPGIAVHNPGEPTENALHYRVLDNSLVAGFENIYFHTPESVIVGGQEGFFEINPQYDFSLDNETGHPGVFVQSIILDNDSVLYDNKMFGNSDPDRTIHVKYGANTLRFNFIAPEYRMPDAITYSCMLENYDNDWSTFNPSNVKVYTHLPPGEYVMKVRAKNYFSGQESIDSIRLVIDAPWYLTTFAKICYVLLVMVAVYLVVLYVRRRVRQAVARQNEKNEAELQNMKHKAERELLQKNYQIEVLKGEQLELDIKHKSNELTSATMNNMRKNEILLDVSTRLEKVAEGIPADDAGKKIVKQLEAIRRRIRENISHDDDWKTFTHNFDSVYGNFLKRLTEQYPDLSIADQKVCVYIRMGLRSKEIAPLLNISYRSVEMSRYRLRKKLGLQPDDSLSGYIMNF